MEDDDLEWEEWNPSKITFVNHMIAGSVAGLIEHVTIYPIDTIKTHIQYEKSASFRPLHTWNNAASFVKKDGFFRLWRGVSAMFAGCIPGKLFCIPVPPVCLSISNVQYHDILKLFTAHSAYFAVFEATKTLLGADTAGHHPIQAAACGALAAISHDLFLTPFDVVKQRMQLGYYKSVTHCIRTVFKTEGIAAFYMSFPATLMMNIPFGGVMVAVNESVKKVLNPDGEYSISTSMIAGSIAGAVAAAVTTPLDVVKTRLQTQNLEHCTKSCEDPLFNPPTTSSSGGSSAAGPVGAASSPSGASKPSGRSAASSRSYHRKGLSLPYGSSFPNVAATGVHPFDNSNATLATRSFTGINKVVFNKQRAGGELRTAGVFFSSDSAKERRRVPHIRMRALVTRAGPNSGSGGSFFSRHALLPPRHCGGKGRRSVRAATCMGGMRGPAASAGAVASFSCSGGASGADQAGVRCSLGMVDMAKQIFAREGAGAFFKGVIPRMLVHAPSVAISWTAYETMKSFLMDSNNN